MSLTVNINGIDLDVKEYNGERVVTFKDIDAVHKRPEGTASRNFRKNRSRFIEGVDYYRKDSNSVVFVNEVGYALIVKSFTDDSAWSATRGMIREYFHQNKHSLKEISEIIDNAIEEEVKSNKMIEGEKGFEVCLNIKEANSYKEIQKDGENYRAGRLYAVEWEDGLRIGHSRNLKSQIKKIEAQAKNFNIKIGKVYYTNPHTNYLSNAYKLFDMFDKDKIDGVRVFNISVGNFIEALKSFYYEDKAEEIEQRCGMMVGALLKNFHEKK